MLVYLIRHAEPALLDHQRRFLGARSDPPLSAKGVAQAQQLAERFTPKHFDAVWSSNLARSLRTAELASGSPEAAIRVEPDLREIDLGRWDGLSDLEVQQRYPEEWAEREANLIDYRFPGGETYRDLAARAIPAFTGIVERALLAGSQTVLAVAHKGTNRVILAGLLGKPFEEIFTIQQDYCAVNVLQATRDARGRAKIRVRELAI